MSKAMLFARLAKVNEATRQVTGIIASESPDAAKEIFDYDTSKPNFEKWSNDLAKATDGKNLGNVRAMHGNVAAGALSSVTFDDVIKTIEVTADIVDDNEWNKVLKGVYTGFSIGGKYERKWEDPMLKGHKRYTAKPHEVSLVDLPCNPGATFTMVKADGLEENVEFHVPDEAELLEKIGSATTAEEKQELVGRLAKASGLRLVAIDDSEDLEKSAWGIEQLARCAESAESICTYYGVGIDGVIKPFGEQVKKAAATLYDALLSMVSDDVAAAKERLKGVKKDISDNDELQKMIVIGQGETLSKMMTALGVEDGQLNADDVLLAVNKLIGDKDELSKKVSEQEDEIKKLKEQPAPAKGAVRAIGKGDDGKLAKAAGEGDESEQVETDPLTMLKNIHAKGGRPVVIGEVLAKPA